MVQPKDVVPDDESYADALEEALMMGENHKPKERRLPGLDEIIDAELSRLIGAVRRQ